MRDVLQRPTGEGCNMRDMTMGCVATGGGVATERGNVILQQLAGGGKGGESKCGFGLE